MSSPMPAPEPSPSGPDATALSVAAGLIGLAMGVSEGSYDPLALALVTLGGAAAAAAFAPAVVRLGARVPGGPAAVLGLCLALSFAYDAVVLPGVTVDPARLGGFRPLLAVAAVLAATHAWPRPPAAVGAIRFPLVAATWLALAVLVVRGAPAPTIDVWGFQQFGSTALAQGRSPYSVRYPNPYGPGTPVLSPEALSADGRFILVYPYPPLSAVLGVPAALAGDVRWLHVLATLGAAVLVHALGRRTRAAELAATFLLFQPHTLMVLELAWTEPLVLAAFAGLAVALGRPVSEAAPGGGWVAAGALGGLALATKQYAPLLALPFWRALPAPRWRPAGLAVAVAAASYAPFLLWDPAGLWRSVVRFQFVQPFRPDALSWAAAIAAGGGPRLSLLPAFVAAGAVAVWGALRARSIAAALGAGAAAWLALVLANKQAFLNYYWLAVGLLCAAVAAAARPARGS